MCELCLRGSESTVGGDIDGAGDYGGDGWKKTE